VKIQPRGDEGEGAPAIAEPDSETQPPGERTTPPPPQDEKLR